ncbi:MAG TPA: hypothetical protein VF474_12115 [Phenylobacterium sp.]
MTADPADIDPAEAMLAELAGLDLSLARHIHACAVSTEDPSEVADLARACQRISRSMRQSLALHARLKRERERDQRDHPPPAPPPPPTPARDAARIAQRKDALRTPVQRVVWSEYEDHEDENLVGDYFDLFEERLEQHGRDNAFGLIARGDAWEVEPLDDHVARACRDLGLPEAAARRPRRAKLGLTACAALQAPYFDTKPPRTPSHPLPAALAQAPWRLGGRLVLSNHRTHRTTQKPAVVPSVAVCVFCGSSKSEGAASRPRRKAQCFWGPGQLP